MLLLVYKLSQENSNENEIWNVAKDIINPKKEITWSLKKENDELITDKVEIANTFNNIFVSKIEQLKENIDTTLKEDPIIRLKKSMTTNKARFTIKPTSE